MSGKTARELILLVEDDLDISEMLAMYLRTKQYRLASTPVGSEVLDLCEQEPPDLILLDINLPDIDGYEVCRRLRDNLATSTIPIIFLTQKDQRLDRLVGLQAGGNDYITKPFDMEELYLRVRNMLRKARYQSGIDPISELPSGPLVEEQLKRLLGRSGWAILIVRVQGFERLKEAYGGLVDKFVAYVAQLLRQAVDRAGNFEDFIGRVGTMQYIVITTPPRIERLQQWIEQTFTRVMDPPGQAEQKKPVTAHLRLSFGTVTDLDGPFGDVRSLAEVVSHAYQDADSR